MQWKTKILLGIACIAYAWYYKDKLEPVTFTRSYWNVGFVLGVFILVYLIEGSERYKEAQYVCPNYHCSNINFPVKIGMYSFIEGDQIKLNPFDKPKRLFVLPTVLLQHTEKNFQSKVMHYPIPLTQLPTEVRDFIVENWDRYQNCKFFYGDQTIYDEEADSSAAMKQLKRRVRYKVTSTIKGLAVEEDKTFESKADSIRRIVDAFGVKSVAQKLKDWWRNTGDDEPDAEERV